MISSGSVVSANAVNPRRSRNTTATSRRWLFNGSSAPPARISSASCGEKKRLSRPSRSSLDQLFGNALLQRVVPLLDSILQRLDPQHRLHSGYQGGLVHGFVRYSSPPASSAATTSFGSDLAVTRMIGTKGIGCVRAQPAADFDAVELGHHDVEQHEVGQVLAAPHPALARRRSQSGSRSRCASKPGAQDVYIGRIVVDDQNARWGSHGRGQHRSPQCAAILALPLREIFLDLREQQRAG